ncbi:MAG TPA: ATP-binding protein [Solirubrobacteraceae bacterium]|nr:ATP-binding protein [Solirubrobacteraceae bacterium]
MKRSTNPYTPGAGRRPEKLAGRDSDLENFRLLLERLAAGRHERSTIFSGLRGIGKTVLLLEFDVLAAEAEWFSTGVQEVGSTADFRTSMARLALRVLRSMSLRQRMKDRARAALSVVKAFSIAGPAGISIQIDVDAASGTADTGDIEQDLADLFTEIGEVARAGSTGALFLIDEMQNLDKSSLGAISMALHRVSQRDLPVALIGAGLPTLPVMLRDAKPYAQRLFSYHTLGQLSKAEARMALIGPAALQDVEFSRAAVELVVGESGGYPYFLQEYGRVLWDEVDDPPIGPEHVRAVQDIVEDNLDRGFFGPAFELATDAEQRYLVALATLGDGPYRTAEAANAAGYQNVSGASAVREELIAKELIWSPRRGQIDFTVPRFAHYLRSSYSGAP